MKLYIIDLIKIQLKSSLIFFKKINDIIFNFLKIKYNKFVLINLTCAAQITTRTIFNNIYLILYKNPICPKANLACVFY